LEGVEDCVSVFDPGDTVCAVESFNVETEIKEQKAESRRQKAEGRKQMADYSIAA
jgi:hypothetical protein